MDYFYKYLNTKMSLLKFILQFYDYRLPIEKADKLNIEYDLDFDEFDGVLDAYYHICESCGEYAWNLLDIEQEIITSSQMFKKQQQLVEEILAKDVKIKQKK